MTFNAGEPTLACSFTFKAGEATLLVFNNGEATLSCSLFNFMTGEVINSALCFGEPSGESRSFLILILSPGEAGSVLNAGEAIRFLMRFAGEFVRFSVAAVAAAGVPVLMEVWSQPRRRASLRWTLKSWRQWEYASRPAPSGSARWARTSMRLRYRRPVGLEKQILKNEIFSRVGF